MAEALVAGILAELTAFTAANAGQNLSLVRGFRKEVKRVERNFETIQYVLEDAEEKQNVEKNVKRWLDWLKEVSYEMEDVLDEWNTSILKLRTNQETKSSLLVCRLPSLISCFSFGHQVVRRYDLALKIRKINEELDEIGKEKDRYDLARREIKQSRRLESTSFVDVSKIHGRDEIRKGIVKRILMSGGISEDDDDVQTISIMGMGGIGKTALAQLVFSDDKVRKHFGKKRVWVCVSDFFDQIKIAKAILGVLNPDSTSLRNQVIPLEILLEEICEQVREEKFFLVLDDVWSDHNEDWEPLKAAFRHGMSGSRILVTTRKESVAVEMECSHVFHLEKLSDELCWIILSQMALIGRNKEGHENLEEIGKQIAKKCKGLPLAAKTLGGLLRGKRSKEEWENVLNSEIWRLDIAQEYIFKPLLLSYYDLPYAVRPCLLYCAIFPKDFILRKHELITHWMAHDYLKSEENTAIEMEVKGGEYFNYLASRSFFQDFFKDPNGNITKCKMHDMVHDFVLFLTKNEVVAEEINSAQVVKMDLSSNKARHLRLTIAKGNQFPVSTGNVEKLRSLVSFSQNCGVTGEALRNLFTRAQCFRSLIFGLSSELFTSVEEIPEEIGRLIHLRHIDLSYSRKLKRLPDAICELCNLQILNLQDCRSLKKLPNGIGKLINLRYLFTWDCDSLICYPKGIGNLTSLRKLMPIIAKGDCNDKEEFSVGDFENLNLLHQKVRVKLVGNVIDKAEAKRANFHKKKHLKQLDIKVESSVNKEDVIQALSPPCTLEIDFIPQW